MHGEKSGNLTGIKLNIVQKGVPRVLNYCVLLFLGSLRDFKIFDKMKEDRKKLILSEANKFIKYNTYGN